MDSLKAIERDANKLLSEIRGLKEELNSIAKELKESNKCMRLYLERNSKKEDDDGK